MVTRTLKVTISGSYTSANRQIESFDNVTGIIPTLPDDKATQMIIRRYAKIWVSKAKKKDTDEPMYKHIQRIRQVFVDSIDENDEAPNAVLSYVGKNVMEMNFEELQDFAASNDLSAVPLYKVGSLTHARRVAWSEYAKKVMGCVGPEYEYTNQAFNPSQHEPILADAEPRRHDGNAVPIEETIDREALVTSGKAKPNVTDTKGSKLSLDNLKAIADGKKISYHKSVGYDVLYKKIYGIPKAA